MEESNAPAQGVNKGVNQARRWSTFVAIALALAAAAFSIGYGRRARTPKVLRIATGLSGGLYHPIGNQIAGVLRRALPGVRIEVIESAGGEENLRLLDEGRADMALVSNNALGGPRVKLVTPLYDEVLQIVARRELGLSSIAGLRGRRVNIGQQGSGTHALSTLVLGHAELSLRDVTASTDSHVDAAARFKRGEIDAICVLAGLRTPVIDDLLHLGANEAGQSEGVLLPLGDSSHSGSELDGIRIDAPFLNVTTIPQGAYGAVPTTPIGTVSVSALLVVREELSESFVQRVTHAIFEHKAELSQRVLQLSRLSERFDPAVSPFPLHAGADAHYRRNDPPFVSKYANEISVTLSIGAVLWSTLSALRSWRERASKGRIEAFYRELSALDQRPRETADERSALLTELEALQSRALSELAKEQIEPDISFSIFQDSVRELRRSLAR